jgi:MFS-type transporter involved in bile tolerance (Atg22 family)
MRGLRIVTFISFVGFLSTSIMTTMDISPAIILVAYTLTLSFYLLSFVFYTPTIYSVSNEGNRGAVSGYGNASNAIGQIVGLLVIIPILNHSVSIFGVSGKEGALIFSSIAFLILALPMLFWFKENEAEVPVGKDFSLSSEYQNFWSNIKIIFSIKLVALFLIGYMFVSDALLTFANNYSIFLSNIFKIKDESSSLMIASILISSVIGAIVGGKLADKYGSKKVLIKIIYVWVVLFPMIAFAPTLKVQIIFSVIAGLWFGAFWAVSKATMVSISPKHLSSLILSYYIFAERFATVVGPLSWSLVLYVFSSYGVFSYKLAVLSMAILVLCGIIFIRKVNLIKTNE